MRLLFAPFEGKPVCLLMKPIDKSAPPDKAYTYRSPVGERHFDRVEILAEAQLAVKVEDQVLLGRGRRPVACASA